MCFRGFIKGLGLLDRLFLSCSFLGWSATRAVSVSTLALAYAGCTLSSLGQPDCSLYSVAVTIIGQLFRKIQV